MVYGKPPFFRENTIFKKFKAIVNINYQIAFSSDRNQFRLESSQDQGSSNTNNINENNSTYNINDFVSSPLLEVMKHCLQREPKKRPTIPELLQQAFIHGKLFIYLYCIYFIYIFLKEYLLRFINLKYYIHILLFKLKKKKFFFIIIMIIIIFFYDLFFYFN